MSVTAIRALGNGRGTDIGFERRPVRGEARHAWPMRTTICPDKDALPCAKDEARRIAANIAKLPDYFVKPYLGWRSIWVAPLPSVRMWSGRGLIQVIELTEPANPAHGI